MGNREQFDLSKYLLEKRKQKGLSQTQVANDTGLSSAYISMLEKGERKRPTQAVIKKLATALSIPNIEMLQIMEYIASMEEDHVKEKDKDTSKQIKLFDLTGLTETSINQIQNQIDQLKSSENNSVIRFFDVTGLSEKDIERVKEEIELLKIRNEYMKLKKD